MDKQTQAENNITLKTISDLLGYTYFIPSYQRGYRWQPQQVNDLLNDINEFESSEDNEFYCLQPLVVQGIFNKNIESLNLDDVKKALGRTSDKTRLWEEFKKILDIKYEVIDGQQRLTTIKIILNYLNAESFDVEYATREGSGKFLNEIDDTQKDKNIDYFYMAQAYETVKEWFKANEKLRKDFVEKLLDKTRVIWYETAEKDIIKVFERLNSGKIPLTNAELIKALFLKSSNFGDVNSNELRLYQQEIAMQWDEIEYALQNDEFWYFLNKTVEAGEKYKDTRIDFIFDLICKNYLLISKEELKEYFNSLGYNSNDKNFGDWYSNEIGNDHLTSYRYIDLYFKIKFKKEEENKLSLEEKVKQAWKKVRDIYLTLKEWYNDIELYHYIGFLVAEGNMSTYGIYDSLYGGDKKDEKVKLSKSDFLKKIKEYIKNVFTYNKTNKLKLSDIKYNGDFHKYIKKALLLHNVETMTQQVENQESSKYKLAIFQKFPFHLYKLENWDIEHISSQTENNFNDRLEQLYFLNSAKLIVTNDGLRGDIESVLKSEENFDFNDLKNRILVSLNVENVQYYTSDGLDNLALLDSKTNRSYGNAIFPVKRQCVINKDKAKLDKSDEISSFVPICTKNVFLKYYSPLGGNLLVWTEDDAKAYFNNMKETLKDFIESEQEDGK